MNHPNPRAPWVRIRQICLAAAQLEPAVQALQNALGLQVAYRDPAVGKYGLENAVLPIGPGRDQILQRIRRTESGFQVEEIEPVSFVPLLNGVV